MDTELRKKIQERAYAHYLARGNQGGNAEQDWLNAEKEISQEKTKPEKTIRKKKSIR